MYASLPIGFPSFFRVSFLLRSPKGTPLRMIGVVEHSSNEGIRILPSVPAQRTVVANRSHEFFSRAHSTHSHPLQAQSEEPYSATVVVFFSFVAQAPVHRDHPPSSYEQGNADSYDKKMVFKSLSFLCAKPVHEKAVL